MRARRSAAAIAAISSWLAAAALVAAPSPADPPAPAIAAPPGRAPAPSESPDAFYLSRLTIGQQALAAGHAAEAADNLRVASFGLLSDPAKLTECLVWLSVAQQRAGRTADLDATLRRFQQVQALFPSYASLSLSAGLRSEFEELVRKRDPGLVLGRPREAERGRPAPAPTSSPPAKVPAPGPSAGPALAASLRPAPEPLPLANPERVVVRAGR
ncbi:MAG TPA: hypothetical protein VFL12_02275 [Thermoanaerobaculia bacterium]|nr:hypothetical protein [Thermoanaerobaculia bacterium]